VTRLAAITGWLERDLGGRVVRIERQARVPGRADFEPAPEETARPRFSNSPWAGWPEGSWITRHRDVSRPRL
jgi:hypothetical protein